MRAVALLTLLLSLVVPPATAIERSSAAKRAFQREHPCPSTGQHRGKCPHYVIDHVTPLCASGADRPENMQWQQIADARRKDGEERRQCAALRSSSRKDAPR